MHIGGAVDHRAAASTTAPSAPRRAVRLLGQLDGPMSNVQVPHPATGSDSPVEGICASAARVLSLRRRQGGTARAAPATDGEAQALQRIAEHQGDTEIRAAPCSASARRPT